MIDISVIILVGREERHIGRCLEKLTALAPRQIFVVESQAGDRTHEIVGKYAAVKSVWHDWPGTQAEQFNWALDNLPIDGKWVLRLDADEYLLPDLVDEIRDRLPRMEADVSGVVLKRRHYIFGGWVKLGTYPARILRLFRKGCARYSSAALMDEQLRVNTGRVIEFDKDFVDHSLIPIAEWKEKHREYAKREATQAVASMRSGEWTDPRKAKYYRLPPYLRAFVYFGVRYVLKLGFMDGLAGWRWNFWQGLWYRLLCDREIAKLMKSGGLD